MKLLTDQPWKAITRAVRKCPGRCRVAVAYFGQNAHKLLPLGRGSVLVLDFSERAVRAGQACPASVILMLRRGVAVHSVTNLHAKVFVVGRSVFIGSTNVSQSSANTLVEAVVQAAAPALVRQTARFVDSLLGEHITPEFARQMAKIYRPPKFGGDGGAARKARKAAPAHSRTWVVQLGPSEWDEKDYAAEGKGRPVARRRLQSTRRFEVEDFCWTGLGFARRARRGDLVVQVFEEKPRRYLVSPPERLLHIQNYRNQRDRRSSIVFLETPKALRRKSLQRVRHALGRAAAALRPKSGLALLKDAHTVHRLHQIWPKLS